MATGWAGISLYRPETRRYFQQSWSGYPVCIRQVHNVVADTVRVGVFSKPPL